MLNSFYRNPFENAKYGAGRYGNFSEKHISNLKTFVPAPGSVLFGMSVQDIVNMLSEDTETRYNEWTILLTEKAADKSIKEGKTISADTAMSDFKELISRKEGVIADKFPAGSPVYEELFPGGVSEYQRANKEDAVNLFNRFLTVLKLHNDIFDADMIKETGDKLNTFITAKEEQTSSKSKVNEKISAAEEKRRLLNIQLFKNLLVLLLIHLEKPGNVEMYFDESMLGRASKVKELPAPPETDK